MRLKHLLFSIAVLFNVVSLAQLYTYRNFNHRHGLYMASINCLDQTSDGYIWIGTDGGDLIRFDGDNFHEIRVDGSDNNHHFKSFTQYGDSILFASAYKGFYAYLPTSHEYVKLHKEKPDNGEARACLRLDSNYYFIGTEGIITSDWKGKQKKLYSAKEDVLDVFQVIHMGSAAIILSNKGNYVLEKGELKKLENWLQVDLNDVSEFKFGYYDSGKLMLFNESADRWLEIILNSRGGFFSIEEHDTEFKLKEGERIKAASYNAKAGMLGMLSDNGHIYTAKGTAVKSIAHNYNEPLEDPAGILTDMNGDFWVNSQIRGIYKISLEGFTKLQLLPLYQKPDIMFPYRTIYGDVIISVLHGETYLRNLVDNSVGKEFNFTVHGATEINGDYYFGTNLGIKKYNPQTDPDFTTVFFKNQKITMISGDGHNIWAGVAGKGLFHINLKTDKIVQVESNLTTLPEYFYTSQFSVNRQTIYFGTNNGIFRYSKRSRKLAKVDIPYKDMGSYSGVSTRDIYGTCWFTMEKGLVGINVKNEILIVDGDKNFNTNVFYTLNSDNYGNLIVGTNKGISIIKIDKNGVIKDNRHYDGDSGFDGYETHMRSQFESDEGIFVGTVEGLFLINTKILENLTSPLPPVIQDMSYLSEDEQEGRNDFHFSFHVNNSKASRINYSYRLVGYDTEWKSTSKEEVQFYNLSNGNYSLEVRSSYDGIHYSDVSSYEFTVKLPIWQSNWFIITIILSIVGINVLLLRNNKAFERNSLFDTKDTNLYLKMTPGILLFGTISVTLSHILGPILNSELELHLGTTLMVGFILFTLYFLSLSAIRNNQEVLLTPYLIGGLSLVIAHFFYELYLTNLHPFHILGVIITTMVVPYVLDKIKLIVIFSFIMLALSLVISVLVRDAVYPKAYFLIAVVASLALLIFTSYIRFDSTEKMMFISGIINKGNIPAIAFDNNGTITYVSENISLFIDSNHEDLIGKNISIMNEHVPFEGDFKHVDVLKEFKDGGQYLVPMRDANNTARWIEWSYKEFSKSVKVMLGQDVSDRMELENTYEMLVQNAEDFIFRCDLHGNFVFINNSLYNRLGYTEEDLIGESGLIIVAPSHRKEIEKYYRKHFQDRSKSSYKEFPIVSKKGEVIWIGQHVTTLFAAGSKSYINGYIALARDITKVREQQQLIKEQRDNITDSINYAQRIQLNLLPHERLFASNFKEHLIVFKPKDIVSGDFYWLHAFDGKKIIALADCTGHGVPGSFMTLLGINLMNSIIQREGISDPGQILNELDKKLEEILPRGKGANKMNDGMEITICLIDDHSDEMAFACAGSRFLIYGENEFTMYKSDNKHIGDKPYDGFTSYQTNYTKFTGKDQLYLFTDGFQDQFGGPNDKKYSFRRLLELLESYRDLPLFEQRDKIEKEFDSWIGNGEQTDDLTLISIIKNSL